MQVPCPAATIEDLLLTDEANPKSWQRYYLQIETGFKYKVYAYVSINRCLKQRGVKGIFHWQMWFCYLQCYTLHTNNTLLGLHVHGIYNIYMLNSYCLHKSSPERAPPGKQSSNMHRTMSIKQMQEMGLRFYQYIPNVILAQVFVRCRL
jgi:hypothetical protein